MVGWKKKSKYNENIKADRQKSYVRAGDFNLQSPEYFNLLLSI